jgi:hypothetical protein
MLFNMANLFTVLECWTGRAAQDKQLNLKGKIASVFHIRNLLHLNEIFDIDLSREREHSNTVTQIKRRDSPFIRKQRSQ